MSQHEIEHTKESLRKLIQLCKERGYTDCVHLACETIDYLNEKNYVQAFHSKDELVKMLVDSFKIKINSDHIETEDVPQDEIALTLDNLLKEIVK